MQNERNWVPKECSEVAITRYIRTEVKFGMDCFLSVAAILSKLITHAEMQIIKIISCTWRLVLFSRPWDLHTILWISSKLLMINTNLVRRLKTKYKFATLETEQIILAIWSRTTYAGRWLIFNKLAIAEFSTETDGTAFIKMLKSSSEVLNFKLWCVYGRVPKALETKKSGRSTCLGDDITSRTDQQLLCFNHISFECNHNFHLLILDTLQKWLHVVDLFDWPLLRHKND